MDIKEVLNEGWQNLKAKLFTRQRAYLFTFDPKSQHADVVLKDLAGFCRGFESTFHPDPRVHAVMEGRREVWLRIQQHLNMDAETLWKQYGRKEL